ncbi:GntR family transcriptional regulator [Alicyclobacillaceae bacterium I2511]|nr:GntR family transcriptional regulator [Alicyclobacillaceae bacterium I2511]
MSRRNGEPKYIMLINEVRAWITSEKLRPGQQLPTENDIASQFGISRQTVRQGINELVHEGILYRIQGKGTFVQSTSRERTPATNVIAVVTTYISDYIFPSIIRGIESVLSPNGYSILLLSTHNDFNEERRDLMTVMEKQVDGLIIEPTRSAIPNPNLAHYFTLIDRNIPIVMLHTTYPQLPIRCLRMNDVESSKLVTQHLVDNGHVRIGGIFKNDDRQGVFRLKGFVETLMNHRLQIEPTFIHVYKTEEKSSVAHQYFNKFKSSSPDARPTAIVCYNDEIASELVHLFQTNGILVPDSVSVVGFDNMQPFTRQINNKGWITTIEHPKFEMGTKAAELLLEAIQESRKGASGRYGEDFVFPSILVPGSSTDSIRESGSTSHKDSSSQPVTAVETP